MEKLHLETGNIEYLAGDDIYPCVWIYGWNTNTKNTTNLACGLRNTFLINNVEYEIQIIQASKEYVYDMKISSKNGVQFIRDINFDKEFFKIYRVTDNGKILYFLNSTMISVDPQMLTIKSDFMVNIWDGSEDNIWMNVNNIFCRHRDDENIYTSH